MNTNFQVIGLTRLGIKPESTAQETDALTTRPSELYFFAFAKKNHFFCLVRLDYNQSVYFKILQNFKSFYANC